MQTEEKRKIALFAKIWITSRQKELLPKITNSMKEQTSPDLNGTLETKAKAKKENKHLKPQKESLMSRYAENFPAVPALEEIVEGKVIAIQKGAVYVDLPPFGTGIIFGREYLNARDIIRNVNINDTIAAKIISLDHDESYIELSLKQARQALVWNEAETAIREKKLFELPIKEANKGGLIVEWQGIDGFLPASQLKTEHYPRVPDGDKEKIYEELKKLIGLKLNLSILSASPKEGKLIFSEKFPGSDKEKEEMLGKYQVGDALEGTISGLVDFGVFVKLEEGIEGLVHISEMDWALVENPRAFFKMGDKVKVKIIEMKDGKISLSIKQLKENPWKEAGTKYKKGDVVDGVIIKFNKHGALASIEEGVAGLVHISEFGNEGKLRSKLELGKRYSFKITLFDPIEQRMALSLAK